MPSANIDAEQLALSCIVARNEKGYTHSGKHFGSFLESCAYAYYMTQEPSSRHKRNENMFKPKSECKCL